MSIIDFLKKGRVQSVNKRNITPGLSFDLITAVATKKRRGGGGEEGGGGGGCSDTTLY